MDGTASDNFGSSISISGNTAFIGAIGDGEIALYAGSVYIFQFDGVTWSQTQKLLPIGATNGAGFGKSVSVSGEMAVVGCYQDDTKANDAGAVYFYKYDGLNWNQQTKLTASDGGPYQLFGYSVSILDDTVLVGAPKDDDRGSLSGSAYIFRFNFTNQQWNQTAKIIDLVSPRPMSQPGDQFGYSVGINGDKAFITAPWWEDRTIEYPTPDRGQFLNMIII